MSSTIWAGNLVGMFRDLFIDERIAKAAAWHGFCAEVKCFAVRNISILICNYLRRNFAFFCSKTKSLFFHYFSPICRQCQITMFVEIIEKTFQAKFDDSRSIIDTGCARHTVNTPNHVL